MRDATSVKSRSLINSSAIVAAPKRSRAKACAIAFRGCDVAITNNLAGVKPSALADALFDKYKIHVVGVSWENINTVRVTPHVYTTLADLDKLVGAIQAIAKG